MKAVEGAGLIIASPVLMGCGCCLAPVIAFIVMTIFSTVAIGTSGLISVLTHNKQTVLVTLSIGLIITGGVILFKYFGEKPNE